MSDSYSIHLENIEMTTNLSSLKLLLWQLLVALVIVAVIVNFFVPGKQTPFSSAAMGTENGRLQRATVWGTWWQRQNSVRIWPIDARKCKVRLTERKMWPDVIIQLITMRCCVAICYCEITDTESVPIRVSKEFIFKKLVDKMSATVSVKWRKLQCGV